MKRINFNLWIASLCLLILQTGILLAGDYSSAKNRLRKALSQGNEAKIQDAAEEMIKAKPVKAVKDITNYMTRVGDVRGYCPMVYALGTVNTQPGINLIKKKIKTGNGIPNYVRFDLFFSLQLNESGLVNPVVVEFIGFGNKVINMMAMEESANRRLRSAISPVIDVLSKAKKGDIVFIRALSVLRSLTGKDFTEPERWKSWWKKNGDGFEVPESSGSNGIGNDRGVRGTTKEGMTKVGEKTKKKGIVITKGKYDRVQNVLKSLDIPHTVIKKKDLQTFDLKDTYALLINCDEYGSTEINDKAVRNIKKFVARGGYLFTSDWGLNDVLLKAFPNYVKMDGSTEKGGEVQKIFPAKGATGHPLLKDVFIETHANPGRFKKGKTTAGSDSEVKTERIDFEWKIDELSHLVKPVSNRVKVLITSPALREKYNASGIVALTFVVNNRRGPTTGRASLKGGRVLHILGHFRVQQDPKQDGFALQKMLLNFLVEAKRMEIWRNRLK